MEDLETIAFEIIMHAGESKNYSLEAMQESRRGNFEHAEELLKKAGEEMAQAHHVQTDLLAREARGENVTISAIFVHAQDHLSMATFAKDMAREYVEGFKVFFKEQEGEK